MAETVKQYAVLGYPISQSKSPFIHHRFSEETGISLTYTAIPVTAEEFSNTLNELIEAGYCGFNITHPLKNLAYEACHELSDQARTAEAVNTIRIGKDRKISGHNTDGLGLVADIEQIIGWQLFEKNILILGAGGAVQGVLPEILSYQPSNIRISNRTQDKARALTEKFKGLFPNTALDNCGLDTIPPTPFDIVINAAAASLQGESLVLPTACLGGQSLAIDLTYSTSRTPFCQWADRITPHCYDGSGMLIQQAAYAFQFWQDVMPEVDYLYPHFGR